MRPKRAAPPPDYNDPFGPKQGSNRRLICLHCNSQCRTFYGTIEGAIGCGTAPSSLATEQGSTTTSLMSKARWARACSQASTNPPIGIAITQAAYEANAATLGAGL
jgi:hypothetical protein